MNLAGILVFPDRRERDRYTVRDGQGRTVARIATSWAGTTFTASDAAGHALCAAAARWLGLSGMWHATGPRGEPLLRVLASPLRRNATVPPSRGEMLARAQQRLETGLHRHRLRRRTCAGGGSQVRVDRFDLWIFTNGQPPGGASSSTALAPAQLQLQ